MKYLLLSLVLAMAGSLSAATFPASTNGNNVFFGQNRFIQPVNMTGLVVSNNAPPAATFNLSGATAVFGFDGIDFGFSAPLVGDGSGLINLHADGSTFATNAPDGNPIASTAYVNNAFGGVSRFMYFTSVTNAGVLAGRTNKFQGWTTLPSITTTQSVSGLVSGAYVRSVVSTQSVSQIVAGPSMVTSYGYRTGGGGTISGHYEMYIYDTVSNLLYEIASSAPQVFGATTPTELDFSMSVTNTFTATNLSRVVVALKLDQIGTGSPTLSFVNGGTYDAHANFLQNLSSIVIDVSQVNGAAALNGTNTWTGTNVFMQPIIGNGSGLTNIFFSLTNITADINMNNYGITNARSIQTTQMYVGVPFSTTYSNEFRGTTLATNITGSFMGNGAGLTNCSATNIAPPFAPNTLMAIEGDSISIDHFWPWWIFGPSNVIPGFSFACSNYAVSGSSIGDMDARYLSGVYTNRPSLTGVPSILFTLIGANDLMNSNAVPWQLFWSNYIYRAKSHGFKICAFTVMDRAPFGFVDQWRTNRIICNNYIRQSPLPDWLVDTATLLTETANTNLFYDGTHPTYTSTNSGSARIANEVARVLKSGTVPATPVYSQGTGTNYIISNPLNGRILADFNDSKSTINKMEMRYNDITGNINVGLQSGQALSSGVGNVSLGNYTHGSMAAGNFNTAVGHRAQDVLEGTHNTAIGYYAQESLATGDYNTALGSQAQASMINSYGNTAVGFNAEYSLQGGSSDVAIGYGSLRFLTSGSGDTSIGYNAGTGSSASDNASSISDNNMTFIGYNAGRSPSVTNATALNNGIAIGYNSKVSVSGMAVIGGTGADAVSLTVNSNITALGTVTATGFSGNGLSITNTRVFAAIFNGAGINGFTLTDVTNYLSSYAMGPMSADGAAGSITNTLAGAYLINYHADAGPVNADASFQVFTNGIAVTYTKSGTYFNGVRTVGRESIVALSALTRITLRDITGYCTNTANMYLSAELLK